MGHSNIQLGDQAGEHGSHKFYKSFKFTSSGQQKKVQLGRFFFVRIGKDEPISIGELQLVWTNKNSPSPLASVRLYFLPEQLPDGRHSHHGEDEVLATEKIVLYVKDLIEWIIADGVDWSLGSKMLPSNNSCDCNNIDGLGCNVTIVSYNVYCRLRAMIKRLEGCKDLSEMATRPCLLSLTGLSTVKPNTYVLFCRETFEHPYLENHDFRCDHLAPNLKGRPRKKKHSISKNRNEPSSDEDSSRNTPEIPPPVKRGKGRPKKDQFKNVLMNREVFTKALYKFMKEQGTPIIRVPSLGFKKLDLYIFFKNAHRVGGYQEICQKRLWKHLYDQLGGNPKNTSAATCTKKHYEKLLMPFEKHLKSKSLGYHKSYVKSETQHKSEKTDNQSEAASMSEVSSSHQDPSLKQQESKEQMITVTAGQEQTDTEIVGEETINSNMNMSDSIKENSANSIMKMDPEPSGIKHSEQQQNKNMPDGAAIGATNKPMGLSRMTIMNHKKSSTVVSANGTWSVPPPANSLTSTQLPKLVSIKTSSQENRQIPTSAPSVRPKLTRRLPSPHVPMVAVANMCSPAQTHRPTSAVPGHMTTQLPMNLLNCPRPAQTPAVQQSTHSPKEPSIYSDPDIVASSSTPNCRISELKRRYSDRSSDGMVLDLSVKKRVIQPAHHNSSYKVAVEQASGAIDLSVSSHKAVSLVKKETYAEVVKQEPSHCPVPPLHSRVPTTRASAPMAFPLNTNSPLMAPVGTQPSSLFAVPTAAMSYGLMVPMAPTNYPRASHSMQSTVGQPGKARPNPTVRPPMYHPSSSMQQRLNTSSPGAIYHSPRFK